jgi:CRISPR-associated protein Csd1
VQQAGAHLSGLPDFEPNELLLLACTSDNGLAIHELPQVRSWWAQRLATELEQAATSQCLVTGATSAIVDKHPMLKIPGGNSTGVSLVSFNDSAYESHGWHRNENAPVSTRGAAAYSEALKRLLIDAYPDPRGPAGSTLPRQNYRLSNDTTAVFWADSDSPLPGIFALGFDADPRVVGALLQSAWEGKPIDLEDVTPFYFLVLSASLARATVRSFHVSTLQATARAVRQYFDDIEVDGNRPQPPLRALLRTLAAGGDDKNLSPTLAGELFEAVLQDRPFPHRVLCAAVQRCHADQTNKKTGPVPRDRAALLKACLNQVRRRRESRNIASTFPHLGVIMDPLNRDVGYLLGRLFACLERMQRLALGSKLNVTIVDRYFSSAGSTPRAVFPRLMKGEAHHFAKARDGDYPGAAIAVRRMIGEICDELLGPAGDFSSARLPTCMPLEQQALFALAYHQQCHMFFTKQPAADPVENLKPENLERSTK